MDTLTHALSGALAARATDPGRADPGALPPGRRAIVGFFAAAAPDLDYVVSFFSPVAYLLYHRGLTHSLFLLPLWAWLLARAFALAWGRDRTWRAYYGACALGIGAHIAGDLITGFGTMVFAPFSDARLALGTTFIIDLWFSGIVVAGLAASAVWRRSRTPALAGCALLAAYVAFQAQLQSRAQQFGAEYARAAGLANAQVSALPRPVSPFNWMVIVRDGDDYHYSFVHLARREPRRLEPDSGFIARLDAHYLPAAQAQWVRVGRFGSSEPERALAREAWNRPELAFFRWFAVHPVLHRIERRNPGACAWFQDLRFFTPGRDAWPFRFGVCREADGEWRLFQLGTDGSRRPLPRG